MKRRTIELAIAGAALLLVVLASGCKEEDDGSRQLSEEEIHSLLCKGGEFIAWGWEQKATGRFILVLDKGGHQ